MPVLSPWLALYFFRKMTEDIGSDISEWPKREMGIWNEKSVTVMGCKAKAGTLCQCDVTPARNVFSRSNGSISIGWSVYPDSLQAGRREGPATVINALPCRHGGRCLSAVSPSCFPVLLPDISLMWLDNKEIDSDHYAALKRVMSRPSVIQPASNSTAAVGKEHVSAAIAYWYCTYKRPPLCYVKPEQVTFLNHLLLLLSLTPLFAYLVPQDGSNRGTWHSWALSR